MNNIFPYEGYGHLNENIRTSLFGRHMLSWCWLFVLQWRRITHQKTVVSVFLSNSLLIPKNELISMDDHRNQTTFIFLPHLQFEPHLNAPVYPLFQVAISAGVTKEFLLFFLLWTLRRVFSFDDFWRGEIHLGEFLEMSVALVRDSPAKGSNPRKIL